MKRLRGQQVTERKPKRPSTPGLNDAAQVGSISLAACAPASRLQAVRPAGLRLSTSGWKPSNLYWNFEDHVSCRAQTLILLCLPTNSLSLGKFLLIERKFWLIAISALIFSLGSRYFAILIVCSSDPESSNLPLLLPAENAAIETRGRCVKKEVDKSSDYLV